MLLEGFVTAQVEVVERPSTEEREAATGNHFGHGRARGVEGIVDAGLRFLGFGFRPEAIFRTTAQIELAHALFDLLTVPLGGREHGATAEQFHALADRGFVAAAADEVVLFFVTMTFSAVPREAMPCACRSPPLSLVMTAPPVRLAMSSSISPCSSPIRAP